MEIKTILKKIKENLTEEEKELFLNQMRNHPEKILESLTANPKTETEKIKNLILNDIDRLIRIYGTYNFYDKCIYWDVNETDNHIKQLLKLKVEKIKKILLELLDDGCNPSLVGHYACSIGEKLNEEDYHVLIEDERIKKIY